LRTTPGCRCGSPRPASARRDRLEPVASCSCTRGRAGWRRGLGDHDARALRDEAELEHHVEAGAERADVAEVAARDDDPVGHLPVELLHDLDGDGLLPLDAQAVHRVREVDALFLGEPLDDRHAAVEVGVEREHERAVRERLHELRRRDLAARQETDRRDAGRRRVGRERRRGVAGRRARDGADRRRRPSSA
jgi:hypothetical protein